ncbi:hypothetical protein DWB58_23295, partial [candidate division KSB1 bacterium]|nr:hypothetical protein [candidate division KSB1 bacterium]
TAFFIWMNRVCSPRPLWAAVEAMKFAVATMPHKRAGLRILYTHLKNAVRFSFRKDLQSPTSPFQGCEVLLCRKADFENQLEVAG